MNIQTSRWASILSLASLLTITGTVLAQDAAKTPEASTAPASAPGKKRQGPGGTPAGQRDMWIKEVGASEEQAGKIRDVLKSQGDKVREIRTNESLSQEDRRAKMKELRDGMTAQIKGILTPDQFDKYQKLQEQRRQQGRGPKPGEPKPPGDKAPAAK